MVLYKIKWKLTFYLSLGILQNKMLAFNKKETFIRILLHIEIYNPLLVCRTLNSILVSSNDKLVKLYNRM